MSIDAAFPVDPAKYVTFLGAMIVMALSPGPANLYSIRTGLAGRMDLVFAGVAGLNAATLIWFIAAAFGLHILIVTVPVLFHLIAVGGGLYLCWIGVKGILAARDLSAETVSFQAPDDLATRTPANAFREGFFVQILNPKVTLFFTAVLPPFIDITRPMPLQMSVFAATTIGMDVVSMSGYGLAAVSLSHLLSDPRNKQRFDMGASAILLVLGLLVCIHSVWDLLKVL